MNREQVRGNVNELKGKLKQKWGQLTDDDLTLVDGQMDELIGRIQKRYGGRKENIQQEIDRI